VPVHEAILGTVGNLKDPVAGGSILFIIGEMTEGD
jgi:hypothetical protein